MLSKSSRSESSSLKWRWITRPVELSSNLRWNKFEEWRNAHMKLLITFTVFWSCENSDLPLHRFYLQHMWHKKSVRIPWHDNSNYLVFVCTAELHCVSGPICRGSPVRVNWHASCFGERMTETDWNGKQLCKMTKMYVVGLQWLVN